MRMYNILCHICIIIVVFDSEDINVVTLLLNSLNMRIYMGFLIKVADMLKHA